MNVGQIIERIGGASDWSDIYAEFGGDSQEQVLAKLNAMYPHDDGNEYLANKIAHAIRYYGEEGPHPRAEF